MLDIVTSPDEKASGFSVRQKFPLWRADSKSREFKNVRISVDGAFANICRSGGILSARDFSCAVSGQNHPGAEKTSSNQGIVAETRKQSIK